MKNQILIPVLLPTEDASELFIHKGGYLCLNKTGKREKTEFIIPQHLYLTSDALIKEGDRYIHYNTKTKEYSVFKAADKFNEGNNPNIIDKRNFVHEYWNKKIEFTKDPKLIADGVPAIDGNTKAFVKDTVPLTERDFLHPANFLSELCKRWNEKNHKGLDLDKISSKASELISKITKKDYEDFVKKDNQKVDVEKWFKNMGVSNPDKNFRAGFRDGYNQALQSKAGFSLEDMRKAIELLKESAHRFNRAAYDENASIYDDYAKEINKFIQSLTKETPKGEIVIELSEGKLIFR